MVALDVDTPVMEVRIEKGFRTVHGRCPYCGGEHTHGEPFAWLAEPGDIIGHRVSHCASGGSYHLRLARGAP